MRLCYLVLLYFLGVSVRAEDCTTVDKKLGKCIPIKSCEAALRLLDRKPLTQDVIDYLRKSQCGYQDKQPKICCENVAGENTGSNNLIPDISTCGLDPNQRIVGGNITSIGEFPWMALLEYDKPSGRGFHCGGTLINNRYILTAAHCIKRTPKTWKLISVRLGEHKIGTDPDCDDDRPGFDDCADPVIDVPVEDIIVNENYIPKSVGQPHDIALLRLSRTVTFSNYVMPICLPLPSSSVQKDYKDTTMIVSGWGRTENNAKSNIKLKLAVPVVTEFECTKTYKGRGVTLVNGQFCAGGIEGQDSCTGDSGGPLMILNKTPKEYNWYITGVVSFGPTPCGIKNWPGVYTRVTEYLSWIQQNMKP